MKKLIIFLTSLLSIFLIGCEQKSSNSTSQKINEAVDKVKVQLEQAISQEKKANEKTTADKDQTKENKDKSESETPAPTSAD